MLSCDSLVLWGISATSSAIVAAPPTLIRKACGDAAKRFDLAEEVFDQMAPPVFLPVVRGMPACPLAKRDDSFDMSSRQALAQPMGVERFVSDKGQAINA